MSFCLGLYNPANASDVCTYTSADTVSPKKITGVSYNGQTRNFEVRYLDGTTEAIDRQTLDERNIYYPGHPEKLDSILIENGQNAYKKRANVDSVAWQKHLDEYFPTYLHYAVQKGLRKGKYKVSVRFIINTDGSLSDFTATPNPGYKFIEFVTAIFSNGPRWSPAEQDGIKVPYFLYIPT